MHKTENQNEPDKPEWITSLEASRLLGLTGDALANMRWRRKGPPYAKLGHSCIRYHRATVLDWMAAQQVGQ